LQKQCEDQAILEAENKFSSSRRKDSSIVLEEMENESLLMLERL